MVMSIVRRLRLWIDRANMQAARQGNDPPKCSGGAVYICTYTRFVHINRYYGSQSDLFLFVLFIIWALLFASNRYLGETICQIRQSIIMATKKVPLWYITALIVGAFSF